LGKPFSYLGTVVGVSYYFILSKWITASIGTVTQIKASGNGNVKVAVYAYNAGNPGAPLNAVNVSLSLSPKQL
jgi:hypothetical protein